jgi:type VI secretion system protein ImpL
VTILPEIDGKESAIKAEGHWALYRLLSEKAARLSNKGDFMLASFLIGGRGISYKIAVNSPENPFLLKELQQFKCPDNL